MLAPPRPPVLGEVEALEALIREARARRRRRWLLGATAIALGIGVGFALWTVTSGGRTGVVKGHGPIRVVSGHVTTSLGATRGIGDVGSSGGVTWAINGHGIWLTTTGGRTWRRMRLLNLARGGVAGGRADPIANIADVQFVDRWHGWVTAMGRSRIYRTTNGGRTWHVFVPRVCAVGCEVGAIDFLDARHGYALLETRGPDNKLFRTEDGGRTWQLVSRPSVYGRITFTDAEHGFAFGGQPQTIRGLYLGPPLGYLYETTDGRRTWSRRDPAGSGSFVEPPFTAFDREVLVVQNGPNRDGGLNLAAATIYASHDAGRSWSGRAVPSPPTVAVSFSAASPSVWALSSGPSVFLTENAGRSWHDIVLRNLPRSGFDPIRKLVFTSSRVGWAILSGFGPDGMLFRTTDGGRHWTPAGPRFRNKPQR